MPDLAIDKVEVYVFRRRGGRVEFLALQRAPGRTLPGVWQPVTGKLELFETVVEAARREVREETGLSPPRWWRLEHTTLCLDTRGRTLMAVPLLAAEVDANDPVTISKEHTAWRFASAAQAAKLFLWDSQRAGLEAVARQVLPGGARADALELKTRPNALARALQRRPARRAARKRR